MTSTLEIIPLAAWVKSATIPHRLKHFISSKDIQLVPKTLDELEWILRENAVSYVIPEDIISKTVVRMQVSRFGHSLLRYIESECIDESIIETAILNDPSIIQYGSVIGIVAIRMLPLTFDEVMELPVNYLKDVLMFYKYDDYAFMKHFPIDFIIELLREKPELYIQLPEMIKYDERVLAAVFSKLTVDELLEGKKINQGLLIDIVSHCSEKQRKRIAKTIKLLFAKQ